MKDAKAIERLAHDPTLVVISRLAVLIVCGLVAWTGTRLIGTLDRAVEATNRLTTQVSVIEFRVRANDKRIDRLETIAPRSEADERKYP